MNKLLVTGLAVAAEVDLCDVCNYDIEWLIRYPSTLLWADKIIVTKSVWQTIQHEAYPFNSQLAKAVKLIFDIAQSHGLIEIASPTPFFKMRLCLAITQQVDKDLKELKTKFPSIVQEKDMSRPGTTGTTETVIDGIGYCQPYISSIYTSLLLAKAWKANCLFEPRVLHYMQYKLGMKSLPKQMNPIQIDSFSSVFSAILPNKPIIPQYAFTSDGECLTCKHEKDCRSEYLLDLEKSTEDLMKWREYDELSEAKSVLKQIVDRRQNGRIEDLQSIQREFETIQNELRVRTRKVFPKVKRWSNISTMVSIPFAVSGLCSGVSPLTIAGATLAGLSQIFKQYLEFKESQYQWIGFIQKMRNQQEEGSKLDM